MFSNISEPKQVFLNKKLERSRSLEYVTPLSSDPA